MDNKLGQTYPSPSLIRLYITKAIQELTEKEIAERAYGEPANYTFGAKAISVIEKAVTKACDDFDKDGVFAGIKSNKKETEDA